MTTEWQHQIIDRVEEVRQALGLNKSQFAARIDMKPQTYNNFIGAQGSKPNVELLVGIVRVFDVNPFWLLMGPTDVSVTMFRPSAMSKTLFGGELQTFGTPPMTGLEILRQMKNSPAEHILNMLGWIRQDIEDLEVKVVDFRRAITKE